MFYCFHYAFSLRFIWSTDSISRHDDRDTPSDSPHPSNVRTVRKTNVRTDQLTGNPVLQPIDKNLHTIYPKRQTALPSLQTLNQHCLTVAFPNFITHLGVPSPPTPIGSGQCAPAHQSLRHVSKSTTTSMSWVWTCRAPTYTACPSWTSKRSKSLR